MPISEVYNTEYFNMQEKRFREECFGEVRLKNGNVYKQKELFEL